MSKIKYMTSVIVSLIVGLTAGLLINRQRHESFEMEKEQIIETFRHHDYQRQILKKAETEMWTFAHDINGTLNNAWKNGADKISKDSMEFMVNGVAKLTDKNLRLFMELNEIYRADSIYVAKLGAHYTR